MATQPVAMRAWRRWLPAGLGMAFLTLAIAFVGWPTTAQDRPQDDVQAARSLSRVFRRVAEAAIPTVVKISTRTNSRVERRRLGENPFRGTPFEDFFNDDSFPREFREFRSLPREGLGSGVIIDANGVVLTNRHVVEGADQIFVQLYDGREMKVADVRKDDSTDLAVIQLEGDQNLPYARFGNSDALEIGDWVVAVGNPFDQEATVTAGIISAKGRTLLNVGRTALLQTDAAINPGNSGGPLLDLDGNVVGINTAIASNTGGYQGIGFAIPSNTAKWVASQLIQYGTVRRAYLGVSIADLSPEIASRLNVPRGQGVVVTEVHPDTPAARAGLREDDVILEFAGRKIASRPQLQALVEQQPVGSKQNLVVQRDGKAINVAITLEALKEPRKARGGRSSNDDDSVAAPGENALKKLGVSVSDLTPDLAKRLGYEGLKGVLVTDVDVDSNAYRKGLRDGMLILAIERQPVASVEDVERVLAAVDVNRGVLLRVRAGNVNTLIVVD